MVFPLAGKTSEVETFTFNFVKRRWDGGLDWDQPRPNVNYGVDMLNERPSIYLKLWGEETVDSLGKLLLYNTKL